jgi:hypothetical protein
MISALFIFACATAPPRPPDTTAPPLQKITFRVLDSRDRPVTGAKITLTPEDGRPRSGLELLTNARGQAVTDWEPKVVDRTQGTGISDRFYTYLVKLKYQVQAKGYAETEGSVQRRDSSRRVTSPELKSLDRGSQMRPLVEVVVLHGNRDLLGGELAKLPLSHPLVVRCLRFRQDMLAVLPRLGSRFAWPAFSLRQKTLDLSFQWQGLTWGGLSPAPLKAQVTVNSGLPLAIACGDSLLPLPGVEKVSLVFWGDLKESGDPHAAPDPAAVIISAPAKDFQALASGRLSPDGFLERYPPALRRK